MYLPPKDKNNIITEHGFSGLPEYYPTPKGIEDMLFYIQRNQNTNTIVYQINRNSFGEINNSDPINVFWKQYNDNGKEKQLNYIQRKLAYGYEFQDINIEVTQIQIVAYPQYKIYITKKDFGIYKALSKINNIWAELLNVYVFANESGAFPVVKYIELYGQEVDSKLPCYEKIIVD
ncbi:MAG: DUF4833 domain-containing protein [Saprospiraceae bacterium]